MPGEGGTQTQDQGEGTQTWRPGHPDPGRGHTSVAEGINDVMTALCGKAKILRNCIIEQ